MSKTGQPVNTAGFLLYIPLWPGPDVIRSAIQDCDESPQKSGITGIGENNDLSKIALWLDAIAVKGLQIAQPES